MRIVIKFALVFTGGSPVWGRADTGKKVTVAFVETW